MGIIFEVLFVLLFSTWGFIFGVMLAAIITFLVSFIFSLGLFNGYVFIALAIPLGGYGIYFEFKK